MKCKITITCLLILIALMFVHITVHSLNTLWGTEDITDVDFYAGQSGIYCYPEGNIPKTINNPIFFETLEECNNYILRNKQ